MRILKQGEKHLLDISYEEWIQLGENNRWLKAEGQVFDSQMSMNPAVDYLKIEPTPTRFINYYKQNVEGDMEREEDLEHAAHLKVEEVLSGIVGGKQQLSSQDVGTIISNGMFTIGIEDDGVYLLGNKNVNSILEPADLEIISRTLDTFASELENDQNDDIVNII